MNALSRLRMAMCTFAQMLVIGASLVGLWGPYLALAAEPVKIGFSLGLTGANAPNGKQLLIALEIWRDDVNAKGGYLVVQWN